MSRSELQPTDQAIGEAHSAIIQQLLTTGRCPSRFQLATNLKTTEHDVESQPRPSDGGTRHRSAPA